MAVHIVDLLEPIDVDKQHRRQPIAADGSGEHGLQSLQHQDAAGQTGHGVVGGLPQCGVLGLPLRCQRLQHLGTELDAASHRPQQGPFLQVESLVEAAHHQQRPFAHRRPVSLQLARGQLDAGGMVLGVGDQQRLLGGAEPDAEADRALAEDRHHFRIHRLGDAIDHVAQGVGIFHREGGEHFREQVQRPGNFVHAKARATKVWL